MLGTEPVYIPVNYHRWCFNFLSHPPDSGSFDVSTEGVGADGAAVVAAAARLAITAACGNRAVTAFGLFGRLTGAKASAADHPGQFERQYEKQS